MFCFTRHGSKALHDGIFTLAKIIMGLVTPTSGKILWNGEDITELTITERAKKGISYGFQQPPRFGPAQSLRPGSAPSLRSG